MDLNSPFVQWLLKWGLSRGGIAIQYLVGLAIGAIAQQKIFPDNDLETIRTGLESGLTALLALVYGWFVWWLQHRQKDGVRAIQSVAQLAPGAPNPKLDGIAGNDTIKAVAKAAGVPADAAVANSRL